MARITLNDVNRLPDPLLGNSFTLFISRVTGMSRGVSNLPIKLQSFNIPPYANESYEIKFAGHKVKHRGALDQQLSINCLFTEDVLVDTYATIYEWHKMVVDPLSGNSFARLKASYSCEAWLETYDQTGRLISVHRFEDFYPERVEEIQLDGSQSIGVTVGVTFAFSTMSYNVRVPNPEPIIIDR